MKFIWEKQDIVPGRQLAHTSAVYTIVSVDTLTKVDTGYALLTDNRVGPTYTAETLVKLFNDQNCVPLSL
jgi:hypothetical protein